MFNLDKIKEEIERLSNSNMVSLWNEYCDANEYYDDWIEYNDPDELFHGWKPSEIFDRIDFNNYDILDDYCTLNGNDCYVSFDYVTDNNSPFDLDSLANWIYDNEDACGYLDEDDISDHLDAISFVDEYFDDDDVGAFIEDNGIDVDENTNKYDAVKDYLEQYGDDVDEIVASLSGLGWLCDIEERVLQYFN